MKKTYMIPTLKVVKVQPAQLMTDSTMNVKGNYDSETISIGARQSRFSRWEEDDFEEE